MVTQSNQKSIGGVAEKNDFLVPESEWEYTNLPKITGMPLWEAMETTSMGFKTPDFCRLDKLLNYPANLQEPQVAVEGTFGTGKSQLLNFYLMIKLAQGYKGIMFIDRHVEVRNIVPYGYYKPRHAAKATPFQVTIWTPQDYEYEPWKLFTRANVEYKEWSSVQEIIENLAPHTMQAVYYDCYDRTSRIHLWIDSYIFLPFFQALDLFPIELIPY